MHASASFFLPVSCPPTSKTLAQTLVVLHLRLHLHLHPLPAPVFSRTHTRTHDSVNTLAALCPAPALCIWPAAVIHAQFQTHNACSVCLAATRCAPLLLCPSFLTWSLHNPQTLAHASRTPRPHPVCTCFISLPKLHHFHLSTQTLTNPRCHFVVGSRGVAVSLPATTSHHTTASPLHFIFPVPGRRIDLLNGFRLSFGHPQLPNRDYLTCHRTSTHRCPAYFVSAITYFRPRLLTSPTLRITRMLHSRVSLRQTLCTTPAQQG